MSDLTIGAAMEVLGSEYYGGILVGIERVARKRDARLLVFRGTPGDVAAAPFAREVRGWIAVHSPRGLAALARLGLPLVTIAYHDPDVGCPAVVADNTEGVREAVRHLIAHGHRRIAFIGWLGYPAIAERYEGYRHALTESGLPRSPELIIGVEDNHVASGREGARRLLEGGALPCTAVVVGTDLNAVGVMEVLQAAGLRVPADVAVVGFDDDLVAQLADPPLTTLRSRYDEYGRRAANLLLDEISGIAAPRTTHRVPATLIRRRSCGCEMADTLRPPPRAEALGGCGNGTLAAHLVSMVLAPVPPEPGRVPAEIWPGAETLIGGIDAALAGDPEPNSESLRQAWQQAVHLTPDLDVLRATTAILSDAATQRLAATPPDQNCAHRLAAFLARSELELWRARVAYGYEERTQLEELTHNSQKVAMVLLSGKTGQAQTLDWLSLTPARWGCLALYTDATRAPTSTLSVAGTYRRSGPPLPNRGTQFVVGRFPPAEWYPASGPAVDTDVLVLLPVESPSRDWGALVLRSPIETQGEYNAQHPNNMAMWGGILAAALERDALAAKLAELAEEDRKRAEQALERSETTLAQTQRLGHMGSWMWDRASGTISWSAEMFRLFDLDPRHGEPSQDLIDQRLHPDDRQRVHSVRADAVREKADLEHEYRILLLDGTLRHVQATCHPVLDRAGDVVEVFGTARDVTERKQAAETLGRLAAIVESSNDAIISKNLHGIIQTWNPGAERLFGYSAAEAIGRSINMLIPPESIDEEADILNRIRRGEPIEHYETVRVHKAGHRIDISLAISPIRDGQDRVIGASKIARDITNQKRAQKEYEQLLAREREVRAERKQVEDALREAQAALAHVTRVTTLGEVTASIAHEINQPIAAATTDASTCVRWLSRAEPDLDEARQAAQRTVKAVSRAAAIVTRIRRLFKRSGFDSEPVNLNDVVDELITLLRREAVQSGVSITTALAPDLPRIMGDRVQIQQVLLNLVMNSIEATKNLDDRREITVSSRRADGDHVEVAVTDTGIGLPPMRPDELFKAFFTTKAGGTGMGLAISRSIIEAHGGQLWAASNADHGATFTFALPIARDAQA
jgi:PAS domain S-box-containing protein